MVHICALTSFSEGSCLTSLLFPSFAWCLLFALLLISGTIAQVAKILELAFGSNSKNFYAFSQWFYTVNNQRLNNRHLRLDELFSEGRCLALLLFRSCGCKKYAARVCNSLPHILCLASLVFRRGLFGSFKRRSLRSGRWRLKAQSRYRSCNNRTRRIPGFVNRCRVPHAWSFYLKWQNSLRQKMPVIHLLLQNRWWHRRRSLC